MKNKLLHALSNRKGPFGHALLPGDPMFAPATFSADEDDFRKKLFLDVTDTPYYLMAYVALLHAFPDLERKLTDFSITYRPEYFFPRGVSIDGADMVSSPNASGLFTDPVSTSLPVNLTYTIARIAPSRVLISAKENGTSVTASCTVAMEDPNMILHVDWPEGIPFSGPLRLKQTWAEGTTVTITVMPSRFPYKLLVTKIARHKHLSQLLLDYQMIDTFNGSVDYMERLAIVLTMLALSNPAVYPV